MKAFACGKPPVFPIAFFFFLLFLGPVRAKVAMSILGAWVEGRDTAFCGGLSRDLGLILAEDTALQVYDLRKKHGAALDSAQARGALREAALLASLGGNRIKWGLAMECAESPEEYACVIEALDLGGTGDHRLADTLRLLPESREKRKQFGQAAAGRIASLLIPGRAESASQGTLKFRTPVHPGKVIQGITVIRKGSISEVPMGATLLIGDAPGPFLMASEGLHYVLYPHSSYTYMLPKVILVNRGSLGIVKGADSAALDSSGMIWKSLARVSAPDSADPVSVVLTPSFVARGEAQAAFFRHEEGVSSVEVIKGGMSVRPLLSSQEAVPVGAMRAARTRGYSLKVERLSSARADGILRDFETVNAGKGARTLAKFLPGKLFSSGSALRTAGRPVQAFIASGFRELDMEVGVLSPEKEVWSDFGGTFRAGAQESGCYLCSPDRLGP